MDVYLKNLLTEICKRGCILETDDATLVTHLPKCLVSVKTLPLYDNSLSLKPIFKIKSIVPTFVTISFIEILDSYRIYVLKDYRTITFKFPRNYDEDMKQLDILVHYLYCNSLTLKSSAGLMVYDYFDPIIHINSPQIVLNDYKKNVITKMINNLVELYLLKYLYINNNILSVTEIKILIIDILMKLDNWNSLGIQLICSD